MNPDNSSCSNLRVKTIGVMAPSSTITPQKFEAGIDILKKFGFHVIVHPQTFDSTNPGEQDTGDVSNKIKALSDLATDPSIDLIISACGGNRACFLLDSIENTNTPPLFLSKPIMGYSDNGMLHAAQYKWGIKSIFGPTIQTFPQMSNELITLTVDILRGKEFLPPHGMAFKTTPSNVVTQGEVSGPVFISTFSILCDLIGTQFMPNLQDHILILEDIGEETSRLDRRLWQLLKAIPPGTLAGLVFAKFLNMGDSGRPYGASLDDILRKHAKNAGCPTIINYPLGHDGTIFPICQGNYGTLRAIPS